MAATKFSSEDKRASSATINEAGDEKSRLQRPTNGSTCHSEDNSEEKSEEEPKYYINNPTNLMKPQSSGGVEASTAYSKQGSSSHTIRLSISPSQGDDPGFKSRPEHS